MVKLVCPHCHRAADKSKFEEVEACSMCDRLYPREQLFTCSHCGELFCLDGVVCCTECGAFLCKRCWVGCAMCSGTFCPKHVKVCADESCSRMVCADCGVEVDGERYCPEHGEMLMMGEGLSDLTAEQRQIVLWIYRFGAVSSRWLSLALRVADGGGVVYEHGLPLVPSSLSVVEGHLNSLRDRGIMRRIASGWVLTDAGIEFGGELQEKILNFFRQGARASAASLSLRTSCSTLGKAEYVR